MTRIRMMGALAATCVASLAFVSAADASPSLSASQAAKLQRQVDRMLQRVPGGTQISSTEIVWYGGRVTARFPTPGKATAAASSCRVPLICLYAHANQRGTKVAFSCGRYNIGRWFPPGTRAGVSSWNATAPGTLSTIRVGSPPGTTGAGITMSAASLGNVPRWFNDQARALYVLC